MEWSVKITKHLNGYVIEPTGDTDGFSSIIQMEEDGEEVLNEQLAFKELCYELQNLFAVHDDKHANDGKGQRLTIIVDNEVEE